MYAFAFVVFVFLMMSGIMRNHGYHVSHFLGVIFNNLLMDSAYLLPLVYTRYAFVLTYFIFFPSAPSQWLLP